MNVTKVILLQPKRVFCSAAPQYPRLFLGGQALSNHHERITDYQSAKDANRKGFEQNYSADVQFFEAASTKLSSIWERLGTTRDKAGHSHAGLLHFANILRRHCVLGFENIATYQSYLMWSNFRAGLEALLIIGKFVDDPANAKIWLNRSSNHAAAKKAYSNTFSGRGLRLETRSPGAGI